MFSRCGGVLGAGLDVSGVAAAAAASWNASSVCAAVVSSSFPHSSWKDSRSWSWRVMLVSDRTIRTITWKSDGSGSVWIVFSARGGVCQ